MSAVSTIPLARQYVDQAYSWRFADAPEPVRQVLRNCLLYNLTMGLAVDPADDPLDDILAGLAQESGGSSLLGGRGRRSPRDAAFINAGLITARGQNDTHPEVVTHIGCVVIPAVLALAEACAPEDLWDALLLGYELIPRLALGLADETSRRGFRATPLYGVLGAAVACARVLRLPASQAVSALAIAAQHASGTLQPWADGSQEWRLQVAKASRDAVVSALLARAGMQGAPACLEGASGFSRAYAGRSAMAQGAGLQDWQLPRMTFKPYPGCAFNQSPVHALRALLERIPADQVVALEVAMNPQDAAYPGIDAYGPFASPSGAIMSAPFMLAATLQDGQPGMAHFTRQFAAGPLHARSAMVRVRACATLDRWACRLSLTLASGAVYAGAHDGNFVLDRKQTLALCQGLAREWPERRVSVEALAAAVERDAWQAWRIAAYDHDVIIPSPLS
ncbi:MmgE/PrpD family protein [Bordetella avium]|uniref:MmgE/PrpD family protein n=1 Tax=Bordetella avium TaxID=521 RepID=UPI000E0C1139|nr:MmgE/PrpD family protein [Bordetella avium]RIQ14892.1 hypothetical protein D0432_01845 [Bordetella avium]RIQ55109.1 hypothetical protein D0844_06770 [Bordetella avium]RIQ63920.1 hypothetical protein D0840_08250 [Bordetella avium]RIQ64231.1 hypothetical protein D0842_06765 [Bordetella avium]RIQ82238.1 hypothetical protein D0835_02175 [Bordetella avium]